MKIIILGSGSAYGSPMCFNNWGGIKNIDNPKNKRTRCSALVEIEGKKFVLDMGPDFRFQVNDNNVDAIDVVLLTHGHYDHVASIPELWRISRLVGKKIRVFASNPTMNELKNCFSYMFRPNHEKGSDGIEWFELAKSANFEFEDIVWQTQEAKHKNITSTIFRYQNFAYVTDVEELSEDNLCFLQCLDLLVLECNNGLEELDNGHNNLRKALEWIERLAPKHTVLTHLSVRVDYEEMSALLPTGVELAYDGMMLEI